MMKNPSMSVVLYNFAISAYDASTFLSGSFSGCPSVRLPRQ